MSEEEEKAGPLERAWAAGVFESKNPIPEKGNVVRLDSTNESMIARFHKAAGVGKTSSRHKKGVAHPYWRYETTAMDDTRELIKMVAPFLSHVQLGKASSMIARIERNANWQKNNPEKAKKPIAAALDAKSKE